MPARLGSRPLPANLPRHRRPSHLTPSRQLPFPGHQPKGSSPHQISGSCHRRSPAHRGSCRLTDQRDPTRRGHRGRQQVRPATRGECVSSCSSSPVISPHPPRRSSSSSKSFMCSPAVGGCRPLTGALPRMRRHRGASGWAQRRLLSTDQHQGGVDVSGFVRTTVRQACFAENSWPDPVGKVGGVHRMPLMRQKHPARAAPGGLS